MDKTAYARITATDKYNRKTTSNICEFKLKQPTLPSLSCPQQKIDSNYQFYWTSGDYTKTSSLEVDYNESFKQKITILSTKTNPFVIKNYYQILLTLSSKTSGGNLIARIYSTDNYGRSAYSNMCIFKAKKPSVCSKNSD
ncbi:MAG: hypothetical protein NTY48_02730, partial [Candidatus Diapherotrites archaeon]|nr:hypothetical protein [Candidatus Diapherotrites archaeon]